MPPLRPHSLVTRCPRCLKIKPSLSRFSSTTSSNAPAFPPSTAFAPLPTRRLISLHGQDAHHFLQGLVASNITPSTTNGGQYSVFLNASGRVLYDVFIYPAAHSKEYRDAVLQGSEDPGLLIEVDADQAEHLAKHLERFKLRAKVGIRVMDQEEWGIWSVWPSTNKQLVERSDLWSADDRAPNMGYRIVRLYHKKPEGEGEVQTEQYKLRRMMMGVAEGQAEIIKESALPQESDIDYMGGIDFRKGCYVGQELTIRTHHTGVVRKRILPVQLYGLNKGVNPPDQSRYDPHSTLLPPPTGANISRLEKKGRSAGKWLGGVGNIGLALCRLEVMTDTALTTEGSQWSPEHEFKVACEPEEGRPGGEVKIKAFVPTWHKERAEAQNSHRSVEGKS